MNGDQSSRNVQKNNLVNRLYKSNNKKISASHKPSNLPHLEVRNNNKLANNFA